MTAAIQGRRVPVALGALSLLAIIPTVGTAAVKHDARSISEASANVASGMGLVKEGKARFYEETVFKQVPHRVAAAELTDKMKEATKQLKGLKSSAARYAIAGSVVAVWWDAVDARTAHHEGSALWIAYAARAVAGIGTVGTAVAELVLLEKAAIWLSRINIFLGVATVAASYAIGKLSGDAWVNWLLAQPFRIPAVKDADKNAFIGKIGDAIEAAKPIARDALDHIGRAAQGLSSVRTSSSVASSLKNPLGIPESQVLKTNTKTPFKSEAEMMSKLADVLSEMQ